MIYGHRGFTSPPSKGGGGSATQTTLPSGTIMTAGSTLSLATTYKGEGTTQAGHMYFRSGSNTWQATNAVAAGTGTYGELAGLW